MHVASPIRARPLRPWLPLFLVFWISVWSIESLARDVQASGFASADPSVAELDLEGGEADPRWESELRRTIAEMRPLALEDPDARDALRSHLAALPFVAEVGAASARWPDGIEVPVRMRVPAACVRVGEEYLTVSDDGVVLPGPFASPPWCGSGYLPVLQRNADGTRGSVHRGPLRPGSRLSDASDLDALAVAVSMRAHVAPADFEAIGAPVIDATHAREASVEEPGVTVALAGDRVVWFGRSPRAGAIGELPESSKWSSLANALVEWREHGRDWSLLDVRWDVPDIRWRTPDGE